MLARFERLVQEAVEGSLRRVFPVPLQPVELAKAAARAMEQAQVVGLRGPEVPNHYELELAPADLERFGEYVDALAQQVRDYLLEYGRERGLRMVGRPSVELKALGTARPGSVRVRARFANLTPAAQREVQTAIEGTRQLRLAELEAARTSARAIEAKRLVLVSADGDRFPLEPRSDVVRLGRAADNDVVIESSHVSRYHAQLRWVERSWLVYDLDSTNGTFVGDARIETGKPRALAEGTRLRLGDHNLEVGTDDVAGGPG